MSNFEERYAGKNRFCVILIEPEFPVAVLRVAGKQQVLSTKSQQCGQAGIVLGLIEGEREPVQG
jgi:hypothetical protein